MSIPEFFALKYIFFFASSALLCIAKKKKKNAESLLPVVFI